MANTLHPEYNPLIRKLDSIFTLTDDERQALENLPMQVVVIKEGQDIVREGDRPSRSCLLLSGFACIYKMTGARQAPDRGLQHPRRHSRPAEPAPRRFSTTASAPSRPCRVGFITARGPARPLRPLSPHHRRLLARDPDRRRHLPGMGDECRTARSLQPDGPCLVRVDGAPEGGGPGEDHACDLPITQAEFADAIGVSTVHVNRVLQEMRANGLIETEGRAG